MSGFCRLSFDSPTPEHHLHPMHDSIQHKSTTRCLSHSPEGPKPASRCCDKRRSAEQRPHELPKRRPRLLLIVAHVAVAFVCIPGSWSWHALHPGSTGSCFGPGKVTRKQPAASVQPLQQIAPMSSARTYEGQVLVALQVCVGLPDGLPGQLAVVWAHILHPSSSKSACT